MARLFGRDYTKKQILTRVGDISQIAGIRRAELADGKERGVRIAEFKTGAGLNFTVLLDRGMDISNADYCGRPLNWRSATGDVGPQFYDEEKLEWLYNFFGGLLCTCGMSYCGAPGVDEGKELGLHGRVSNTPAKEISVSQRWVRDEYLFSVTGKVVETYVFGPVLRLTRTISSWLGSRQLMVHDVVENIGFDTVPHMYLFHINLGFPVVDAGAELIAPVEKVIPRDAAAEDGKECFAIFDEPTAGYAEKVYYHEMATAKNGDTMVGIVNRQCDPAHGGFGACIVYNKNEFPVFNQWKQMGQGVYTVGLEPANCRPEGRARERARGTLQFLRPGEKRAYTVRFRVLIGRDEIRQFERTVRAIGGKRRPVFEKNT
jgi:hypothetical protein